MDFYAHSFLAVVYRSLASLGLVALVAGGCDATFEGWGAPPEEVAAVFGVLDVRAARQTVRLEAVRTDPDRPLVPQPLEAELVDEGTGTRIPATMRLVTLDDGSQARLADFFTRIVPGRAYRLEVRDSQGRAGAARTVVPIDHAMRVQAPRRDSLKLTQGVVVEGLSRAPAGVLLRYHLVVTLGPDRNFGDTASVVVESDVGEPVSDGWRVAADPQRDAPELLFRL
ncbi:MAG TPA: hypothetical protein VD948_13380, partial [Rhodothermales bacterium]|nr:hypothetical protein [Rhodothermales bacterium]